MSWTCTCDTQNLDASRYCEFCGSEHRPSNVVPIRRDTAWSPPVPKFDDEAWRGQPRMTPEAVAPYLAELRKAAASQLPEPGQITPEQTAAYLAACRARGYSTAPLEALGPIVEPSRPSESHHSRPRRRASRLALMYPTTEAEYEAAQRQESHP